MKTALGRSFEKVVVVFIPLLFLYFAIIGGIGTALNLVNKNLKLQIM